MDSPRHSSPCEEHWSFLEVTDLNQLCYFLRVVTSGCCIWGIHPEEVKV